MPRHSIAQIVNNKIYINTRTTSKIQKHKDSQLITKTEVKIENGKKQGQTANNKTQGQQASTIN